MIDDVVSKMI